MNDYVNLPGCSFDIVLDDVLEIVCRNCGAVYSESIKICEVCGKDVNDLNIKEVYKAYNKLAGDMGLNIEFPNNTIIGDKYGMEKLAKMIYKQIYEEL